MTVYNKNLSSQCNLPAQIKQVQDRRDIESNTGGVQDKEISDTRG